MARSGATKRRWANTVVVIASAFSLAAAVQFPLELGTRPVPETVRFELWIPTAHTLAGALGLASLLVSVRWPPFGRIPLIAAGLILLSAFFAFHTITLIPALTIGIPALAMLGASPFLGPMPRPEEEAEEERRTP